MAENDGALLVLLLDTSPAMWDQLQEKTGQEQNLQNLDEANFVQQLLLFLNTYLMLQEGNKTAVFAVNGQGSSAHSKRRSAPATQQLLQQLLRCLAAAQDAPEQAAAPCWSAALSRALCLIRKQQAAASAARPEAAKPRILCIIGSPDAPAQYIATMNAIFSAQRHAVAIETCMLGSQDSAFLQQAAHITEGLYLRPRHPAALLQYLLTVFSADTYTRGFLQLPKMAGVDFRASCFCHKKTIDMGYVCSVCLSIFCQRLPECSTCGTVFNAPMPVQQSGRIV